MAGLEADEAGGVGKSEGGGFGAFREGVLGRVASERSKLGLISVSLITPGIAKDFFSKRTYNTCPQIQLHHSPSSPSPSSSPAA